MIQIPRQIIGWHGHGEATIIKQDGTNIILDLHNWIDENGLGEWKEGIKIKKQFPKHFLILLGMKWNKEQGVNQCEDIILAKGIIKGNKLYGVLFSKNLFLMKNVSITFPHKVKKIPDKKYPMNVSTIIPQEYDEEELKLIIQNLKCN